MNLARRQGLLSLLPVALEQQPLELFLNSRFDLAYAAAEAGYRLSLDFGLGRDSHLAMMACVEAVWGREADAREHVGRLAALGPRTAGTYLITIARAALGLLELTVGRPDEAADGLLELTAAEQAEVNPLGAVVSVPDAVEANVRAGQPPGKAEAPLARFRSWVLQVPTDARRSLLARCEALLAQRPPDQAFAEAVGLVHALPPFRRAAPNCATASGCGVTGNARGHAHTRAPPPGCSAPWAWAHGWSAPRRSCVPRERPLARVSPRH